jgi:mitochondrial fission protein ELM1
LLNTHQVTNAELNNINAGVPAYFNDSFKHLLKEQKQPFCQTFRSGDNFHFAQEGKLLLLCHLYVKKKKNFKVKQMITGTDRNVETINCSSLRRVPSVKHALAFCITRGPAATLQLLHFSNVL